MPAYVLHAQLQGPRPVPALCRCCAEARSLHHRQLRQPRRLLRPAIGRCRPRRRAHRRGQARAGLHLPPA
jgi:hypothetical protein